jgi:hypothetical protein
MDAGDADDAKETQRAPMAARVWRVPGVTSEHLTEKFCD